jgi:hypothetical protein
MGWIVSIAILVVVCFNHDTSLLVPAALFGIAGAISFAFPSSKDKDDK